MQEFNIDAFNNFIHDLLENRMTDDDYTLVMDELGFPKPHGTNPIMYKTGCHNVDFSRAKYNLAYYPETRSFYCFSECSKSYNILDLVKTRFELIGDSKSTYKCVQWICQVCSIPFEFADTEQKVIEYDWKKDIGKYRKGKKSIDNSEIKVYDDKVLNYFPKVWHDDWVNGYGISEQTLDKFDIRWYPYRQQIVIPVRDRLNNLRGIRVRNMNDKLIEEGCPRYMPLQMLDNTMYKFPTNSVMYGEYQNEAEIRRRKECWLVESEKSCLMIDTLMNGKGIALGMMGSALSDENVKYILSLEISKLIILADSDFHEMSEDDEDWVKFEQKIMKLCDKFTPYCKVEVIFNNIEIKDAYKWSVTDFTVEQFKQMWKNRVKIN